MALFSEKQHLPHLSRWRRLLEKLVPASAAYRPERHYMRGPGPKYRERHPSYSVAAEPMISARGTPRRRDQVSLHGSGKRSQPAVPARG